MKLFSSPKVPKPATPVQVPAPTIDEAARSRTEVNRLRTRRGVQGNLLAGPLGYAVPANNLAAKQLTGQ